MDQHPTQPMTPAERFFTKVRITASCWLWLGSTPGYGHGQFYAGGSKFHAHRWAYELLVGPVPEGLELDHLCRVPACVRPSHLEPVTHRENVLRGMSPTALNATKTHCPEGHPYDVENTDMQAGHRRCRTCHREKSRVQMRLKRAAERAST